jgi:hypothetical protein
MAAGTADDLTIPSQAQANLQRGKLQPIKALGLPAARLDRSLTANFRTATIWPNPSD